ncbi:SGNH/GDSL hydrolase family protein [Arthrobacter sp. MDT1-65]
MPSTRRRKRRPSISRRAKIIAASCFTLAAILTFGGLYLQQQELVQKNAAQAAEYTPPTVEPDPVAVVFGDSWTNGSAPVGPQGTFTSLAGQFLGYDVTVKGHGGTGFLAQRTVEPATPNFQEQIEAGELEIGRAPELVIVQGGLLDQRYEPAEVSEAATSVLTSVRDAYPNAALFLVGPANVSPEPSAGVGRVETALSDTAQTMEIPFIRMDDLMDRDTLVGMLGEDGVHPTQDGHKLLGEKLATVLRDAGVKDYKADR